MIGEMGRRVNRVDVRGAEKIAQGFLPRCEFLRPLCTFFGLQASADRGLVRSLGIEGNVEFRVRARGIETVVVFAVRAVAAEECHFAMAVLREAHETDGEVGDWKFMGNSS